MAATCPRWAARAALPALLLVVPITAAGQADPRERAVTVTVLDRAGAPVPELAPADVEVREDGVAREVLRVGPARAPMQIALLVDNSQAATNAIRELRDALLAFAAGLREQDEVAIITLGDRPTVALDYTRDRDRLQQAVNRLFAQPASGAYLIDAISDAVRGFRRREAPRPVIVSITTEGPDFSGNPYQAALRDLETTEATYHSLVLAGDAEGSPLADTTRDRNLVVARGPEMTGGRREIILSPMGLTAALTQFAAELTSQFEIVYSRPETLIPPERLRVTASRPGLTVRARTIAPPRSR